MTGSEGAAGGAAPRGDTALRIAHLLEEGGGDELRRLIAELEADAAMAGREGRSESEGGPARSGGAESVLAAWLAERGGRDLSHRSRAFWELVLGVDAGPAHPLAEALWPQASAGP